MLSRKLSQFLISDILFIFCYLYKRAERNEAQIMGHIIFQKQEITGNVDFF